LPINLNPSVLASNLEKLSSDHNLASYSKFLPCLQVCIGAGIVGVMTLTAAARAMLCIPSACPLLELLS